MANIFTDFRDRVAAWYKGIGQTGHEAALKGLNKSAGKAIVATAKGVTSATKTAMQYPELAAAVTLAAAVAIPEVRHVIGEVAGAAAAAPVRIATAVSGAEAQNKILGNGGSHYDQTIVQKATIGRVRRKAATVTRKTRKKTTYASRRPKKKINSKTKKH